MKATVERATLLKCLAHVQSVVERRNTIPILSNVLIEAKDGGLRLMATDLDLQVVETIAAHVSAPGATTVSAHTLFDIARKLPEGAQVELSVTAEKMTVTADRYRSNLATLPRDDFPVIAETDLPTKFSLDAEVLRDIIDGTRFAISTEETRYYLNGIFFHVVGTETPKFRAVATDGHRLARIELDLPDGAKGMPDVIVPRKCVAEIRKLLDEVDGPVEIQLSTSKIRFKLGHAVPHLEADRRHLPRLQPRHPDGETIACSRSTARASRRASTASRRFATTEKTRAVKIALGHDKVTLSVTSPENGTASEEIPAGLYQPRVRGRVQLPLPARHSRPGRQRPRRGPPRRRRRADADPGQRHQLGALRTDADAGVSRAATGRETMKTVILAMLTAVVRADRGSCRGAPPPRMASWLPSRLAPAVSPSLPRLASASLAPRLPPLTFEDATALALALPGTALGTSYGTPAVKVGAKADGRGGDAADPPCARTATWSLRVERTVCATR